MSTLINVIRNKESETEKGISFVKKNGIEKFVSYHDLLDKSIKILGYIQSKGISYKDELVFQLNDNEDFVHSFWAGLLGGIIPVPLSTGKNDEHKLKFFKVWNQLNNPYLICDLEHYEVLEKYAKNNDIDLSALKNRVIDIRDVYHYEEDGQIYESNQDDIAFLQFSSGSTGEPKGVMLKHYNLLANMEGIINGTRMTSEDSLITWLPMSHDMGLIGCHLIPTLLNINQVNINTNDFIRRPRMWLEKASQHKSTLLFSPNFGYRYTLKYAKRVSEDVDLSNVRIIINGAEPISADLIQEFFSKMRKYGMKDTVMCPAYGLAEACLGVSAAYPEDGNVITWCIDRRAIKIGEEVVYLQNDTSNFAATFVDVGYPLTNTSIRITDNRQTVLDEDMLGAVEIKGKNVTSGYYNMEAKTNEALSADGWLNTGDIGFIKNGRLVIVGRYKDVLFVNGQNYFANDLERVIREVAGIPLSEAEVAVGGARNFKEQTEHIVAFIKFKKSDEEFIEIEKNIKRELNYRLGVQISHVIPLKQIPKTTSGKVQRFNLVRRFEEGKFQSIIKQIDEHKKKGERNSEDIDQIENGIVSICKMYISEVEIGLEDNFFEMGISSLQLTQVASELQQKYGDHIKVADFYANQTIKELADFIKNGKKQVNEKNSSRKNMNQAGDDIAIIGISLKASGAEEQDEYWEYIRNGGEGVRDFPENRKEDLTDYLLSVGYSENKMEYHRGAYLNNIDTFDYKYFNILPVEGVAMSPVQRMFLESTVKVVEDAGYHAGTLKGSNTGVYVGYMGDMEGFKYQQILQASKDIQTPTGYLSSNIAGRVSYMMNLKGPSLIVDTACSSSLVALNIACNDIKSGNCEQAIVGGIRIKTIPLKDGLRAGFESEDYRTKPFDSEGNGTGEGEGVISIMVKPLQRAIHDQDHIYAVLKGMAVNSDGTTLGLAAPNPAAQKEVIMKALRNAKVEPSSITYVEAQGTGTDIGDSIEFEALSSAYSSGHGESRFCSLGSVRGNIGHLYEASGLSSLVKCCLMLKNKKLPPLANFKKPNTNINLNDSPFYITITETDWLPRNGVRRCGIHNFGLSGTNSHVILEEYRGHEEQSLESNESHIFTLSAKNNTTLNQLVEKYIKFMENNKHLKLSNVCYTSNIGREHFEYRIAIVADSLDDLIKKLKHFECKTDLANHIYFGVHKRVKEATKTTKIDELTKENIIALRDSGNNIVANTTIDNRTGNLFRIAQLYIRGAAELHWEQLYSSQQTKKVSLPTYVFQKLKCWPSF